MRALVTGATGFVGAHLVRALVDDGDTVHAIVRPDSDPDRLRLLEGATVHPSDGTVYDLSRIVGEARPDVVHHLAALFIAEHRLEHVAPLIEANLGFGTALLEAMRLHEVDALVNTGTVWQHYEDAEYDPVCLYAATKQAFEAIVVHYRNTNGLRAITLELTDTYGPNDPRGKLIALLLRLAREGGGVDISPGEQRLDLVHASDVTRAFRGAAERVRELAPGAEERYVVRSGEPLSVRELAGLVEDVSGARLDLRWGARPYRAREVMEPARIGETLPGWRAEVPLRRGLEELWTEGCAR